MNALKLSRDNTRVIHFISLSLIVVALAVSPILLDRIGYVTIPLYSILVSCLVIILLVSNIVTERESLIHSFVDTDNDNSSAYLSMVVSIIEKLRRPLISVSDDPEQVSLMIANLIRNMGKGSASKVEGFNIVFLGAAGLQLGKTRSVVDYDIDDKKSDPALLYQGALEELSSKSVAVARIVNMMEHDEFISRGSDIQEKYLNWLHNQRSQMQRNPNYRLINSPRAPKWGAPNASILLSDAMATISNKNGVTYVIKDPYVSRRIANAAFDEIYSGNKENISIYKKDGYSDHDKASHFYTVNILKAEITELETVKKKGAVHKKKRKRVEVSNEIGINVIEKAVLNSALRFPSYGQARTSSELLKKGVSVSPSQVRTIWLRHNLNNSKLRSKAAEISK